MQILSRVFACAEIRDMHLRRDGVLLVERTDRDFWVRKPEESTTWVTPYKKLLTPPSNCYVSTEDLVSLSVKVSYNSHTRRERAWLAEAESYICSNL